MKPVFIIAIVAVAMIGVMVPSSFAISDNVVIEGNFNPINRSEELFVVKVDPSNEQRKITFSIYDSETIIFSRTSHIDSGGTLQNFYVKFFPPLFQDNATYTIEVTGPGLIGKELITIAGEVSSKISNTSNSEDSENQIIPETVEKNVEVKTALCESRNLEKYVKFGISGWALTRSTCESFTYMENTIHSHEARYGSTGNGVIVVKIQEFPSNELAVAYTTSTITKKTNESKYIFEEVPWKNAPNGCSMFIEYSAGDFPTAYCVVDNFRIYASGMGFIDDSNLYPFVEKTVDKIYQHNVQDPVVATPDPVVATPDPVVANPKSSEEGGGCLIATATYGSELAPQVQQLRELRDNQLLQTESGAAFMSTFNDIYYSFSPIIADYERENLYFKEAVKLAITPMISTLSLMENANSESEVLGIGISVIALNLGMYLGIPAIVVVGIRKIK